MGEIEVGKCEVCGKENVGLERAYFKYDLQCECHSPNHFELVRHCKDCEPKEPQYTKVSLLTKDLKKIDNNENNDNELENLSHYRLVDLLNKYDKYIQEANDEDRYSEGWYPVCISEFYNNEYKEENNER